MNRSHSNSSMFQSPSGDSTDEVLIKLAIQASLLEGEGTKREPLVTDVTDKDDGSLDPAKRNTKKPKKRKEKCFGCRKKVGLLGFECRCSNTFCSGCRMPEDHGCSIDWKTVSTVTVMEKIVAPKVDHI